MDNNYENNHSFNNIYNSLNNSPNINEELFSNHSDVFSSNSSIPSTNNNYSPNSAPNNQKQNQPNNNVFTFVPFGEQTPMSNKQIVSNPEPLKQIVPNNHNQIPVFNTQNTFSVKPVSVNKVEPTNQNNVNNQNYNNVSNQISSIPITHSELPVSNQTNIVNNHPQTFADNNITINQPTNIVVSKIEPVTINNTNTMDSYDNPERIAELKQKSNNQVPVTYSDGIDEQDDYKTGIKDFLSNKKNILLIAILAFIFVCVVVVKAFYFSSKVDHYEEFFVEIEKKEETMAKAYEGKEVDSKVLEKVAATELISCINSKLDANNLPESITSVINEINNYYNQSNNYFAFKYQDIYTGFTVSYNENQNIFTASTIKGPTDIYLWEMASLEKINLNEELTYTGNYYNTGSGVLKSKPLNTKYTVSTLLDYSTIYSDNAAHNMLMDRFGRENMLAFWQKLGTTAIFTQRSNWGVTNAHDAAIYMRELYRFYLEDEKYGQKIMNNFLNTTTKFILGKNNYPIANKIGWSGSAMHDAAIVFADNPYIVIALSNLGDTNYYNGYFNKVNDLAYRLHTEYWKHKMNMCNSIKQY